jgi:hypothetical protein
MAENKNGKNAQTIEFLFVVILHILALISKIGSYCDFFVTE